jgi:hypothetical protein
MSSHSSSFLWFPTQQGSLKPESGVKTVNFSAEQFVSQHIDALQKQMQQIDPAEVSERYFEIIGAEAHRN